MFKIVELKYDANGDSIIERAIGRVDDLDDAHNWLYGQGFRVLTEEGYFTKDAPRPNNARLLGYKIKPYTLLGKLQ